MDEQMQAAMAEATRLTRAGRLVEATALIQHTLGSISAPLERFTREDGVWTVTWFTRMEPSSWQSPLSAAWPFLTLFLRSASDVADRASFQELV